MSFQSSRKQIKYKQPNSWWLRFRRVVQKTVKVFNKAGGGHLTGRLPKATHLDSKYNHYIAATPGSEDQNCTYTQGSGTQKPMCGHISAHCCVKNIILVTSFPLKKTKQKDCKMTSLSCSSFLLVVAGKACVESTRENKHQLFWFNLWGKHLHTHT